MWTPLVMWPMGISSSTRHGQRWAHMRRETWPCSELTALARRESLRPMTVMQNGLVLVLRLDAAEAHQLVGRDAELVAQRAQVLFDQAGVEAVVTGGDGRVRGEDGVLGDFAEGFVEREAVVVPSARGSLPAGRTRCGLRSGGRRRA